MFCEECRKNLSTVYVIKIVDREITKTHLCEECAPRFSGNIPFSVSTLLLGVLPMIPGFFGGTFELEENQEEEEQFISGIEMIEEETIVCNTCGLSISDFKEIGSLGCGKCYEVFSERLKPLLRKIHSSLEYRGRAPKGLPQDIKMKLELKDLQHQLEESITWEEFEKAAELRDSIKELGRRLAERENCV